MKLDRGHGEHLTYCTNVHAGESLADVKRHLEHDVVAVKQKVAPDSDFGVGLRLSQAAAVELAVGDELSQMKDLLGRLGLYVFTINGFPYGRFHGTRVKERVYRPDWQEDERLAYSNLLAELLSELLPNDGAVTGTISTVPGAFRERAGTPEAASSIARRLLLHVKRLSELERETGRHIQLALEPEPSCLLETTAEAVAFFEAELLSPQGLGFLAEQAGTSTSTSTSLAERLVRRHLGVCLDACHAAVEFEDPVVSVQALRGAGIAIGKAQLSSGLRLPQADAASLQALRTFDDGVYLHQVVVRTEDKLVRFRDLPEALVGAMDTPANYPAEWRVHFHVPIFLERLAAFSSTQDFLRRLLALQKAEPFTQHLEVETYTWDVLPEAYRQPTVHDDLARELVWARTELAS